MLKSIKQLKPFLWLVFPLALFAVTNISSASAATCTWTNGGGNGLWSTAANWSCGNVPLATDDVVFDSTSVATSTLDVGVNGTTTKSLSLNAGFTTALIIKRTDAGAIGSFTTTGNITVNAGSIILQGNTSAVGDGSAGVPYGLGIVLNAANVTVGESGSINADGQGFAYTAGPGKGTATAAPSYGGSGGFQSGSAAVLTYGSPNSPTALGSGGRYAGSNGGGAVKIVSAGNVVINGSLTAMGANGAGNSGSPGSGGSVWIASGTLSGSGTISANGGRCTSGNCNQAGGGRVDVSLATNNFSGTFQANQGSGFYVGQVGSLLFPVGGDLSLTNQTLKFNNCNAFGALALSSSTVTFDRVYSGVAVCTMSATSVTVGATSTLSIYRNPSETDDTINLGAVTVNSGGNIIAYSSTTMINAEAGGSVGNPYGRGIAINATSVTVDAGGSINADGTGFLGGTGPGKGNLRSGGGYGGSGGQSTSGTAGRPYGSPVGPTALGSGGHTAVTIPTAGGGAIKLFVSGGTVTINGRLSANGLTGGADNGAASGGSVWIIASTLSGTGSIVANGGNHTTIGSGGGGRVDISQLSNNSFAGTLQANSGSITGGTGLGQTGSILFPVGGDLSLTNQTIKFNNCNAFGALALSSSTLNFERNVGNIDACAMSATSVTVGATSTLNIYRNNSETDDTFNLGNITVNSGGNIIAYSSTTLVNAEAGGTAEIPYGKGITINATSVTVDAGGSINADGKGFAAATGPGKGNPASSNGGGYGGVGGTYSTGVAGPAYGSATVPTAIGSGGGTSAGGGAIKLAVTNTLTVNGRLSADGTNVIANQYAGSGGSLWITASTLAGSGTISANGGGYATARAGGGGGRLIYSYTTKTFSGSLTVDSGAQTNGTAPGTGSIRGTALSGDLVSSVFDTQDAGVVVGDIVWTAVTPGASTVKMQIRTSPDGTTWTDWLGPNSSSDFYTTALGGNNINNSHEDGVSDRYIQYKATLSTTDPDDIPTLQAVDLMYVVNAAPEMDVPPTASQEEGTGVVNIAYSVRDSDTGGTTACPNCIAPSFQYSLDNGATWGPILLGLPADATTTKTVLAGEYSPYTVVWNAKAQLDGESVSQAMIRVSAYDREGANHTVSSTTAAFALDLENPVVATPNILVIATTSPATIRLGAVTDDNDVEMCVTLDNTESNCAPAALSTTLSLATTPDIAYVIFRDAFGNTTSANAMTPEKPTSMIIRDVSDLDNDNYMEFIAWKAVALPFQRYEVWYSTNGGSTYTLLAAITDRSINYYLHQNIDPELTYNYKVSTVDSSGNASAFSTVVSDLPNGQGGTDTTPPTISFVGSASVSTQSAVISWDTDELSNSRVNFSAGTTTFDTTTGVATVSDNAGSLGRHVVTLSNLVPNTVYYYEVESTDVNLNMTTDSNGGAGYTFTTVSGPTISAVTASQVSNISANIVWNTSPAANSYVVFSTSSAMTNYREVGLDTPVASHSVYLSDLEPGTLYYYYVRSGVATNNNAGQYFTFTTTNDLNAPTITNATTSIITDRAAVVTWLTDEAADSRLEYGTSTGVYGTALTSAVYDTSHSITLTGLSTSTNYYYRVLSADQSGNNAASGEYNFLTLGTLSTEEEMLAAQQVASATAAGASAEALAAAVAAQAAAEAAAAAAAAEALANASSSAAAQLALAASQTALEAANSVITTLNERLNSRSGSGGGGGGTSKLTLDQLLVAITNMMKDQTVNGEGALTKMLAAINTISARVPSNTLEASMVNLYNNLSGTMPPPAIYGDPKVEVLSDSANISWKTDRPANSQVAFAPASKYDAKKGDKAFEQVIGNMEESTTTHKVMVSNLDPETKYTYQAVSRTPLGTESKSTPATFTTKPESADINDYNVKNISGDTATFSWTTTVETDSQVKYIPYRNGKLSVDDAMVKKDKNFTKIHNVTADNLEAGIKYNVELSGKDTKGQSVVRNIPSFSTSDDDQPPLISQVQTESALSPGKESNVQTIISWATNEPANGLVYYQKGAGVKDDGNWDKTPLDPNYTKKHVAVVTKFAPGTIYKFKIQSSDSGGHTATSKVYTVLTPKQSQTVIDVIMKNTQDVFGWTKRLGM